MKIEKIIHQVWIGGLEMPTKWMKTWKEKNPDWDYQIWDNKRVFERKWKNEKQIDFYKRKKIWRGVADIIRYEILYEFGGIMPGADSICLRNIDKLFDNNYELFGVIIDFGRFNDPPDETLKEKGFATVAPLYGCSKGNDFARKLIEGISEKKKLKDPHISVGNRYMRSMILEYKPKIKLFPSYYFVPQFKDGTRYKGNGIIYAEQKWGSTLKCYHEGVGRG